MSRERKKARGKRSAAARTSRAALERALSAAVSPAGAGESAVTAAAGGGSPADILGEAGRLFAAGQYERTAGLLAQALAQTPLSKEAVEMRYVRAASLVQLGAYGEARSEIRRIRDAEPEHPGAALQEIYIEKGEGSTCSEIAHLRQLIAWLEERLAALAEAGGGQQTSLAVYYRKFLAEAQSLLGSALTLAGEAAAGVRAFLASSRLEADRAQGIAEYSNAVFALNYVPQEERVEFAGLVEDFDAFFPAAVRLPSVSRERVHERLRIGYISPDLRWHPVAFFLLPLLRAFDRGRFAVFCYANNAEDAVSRTMAQQEGVAWRNILGLLPEEAARLIREDEIDILVDLSGHTKDNCLPVMALKPAPVQVTGIGYMGRTGLSAMDYLLGDETLDPPEEEAGEYERLLRLSHSHFCYLPFAAAPVPAAPPCLARGFVTFGCFNNYSKVTDAVLRLWRVLMEQVPESRLLLKSRLFGSEEGKALAEKRFLRLGIDAARIELRGFSQEYLAEYADLDIALDTFPYTGGLTTCEALYMGAPVITLAGDSHGARFGASLLKNAGLPELIAASEAEYVEIAKLLAGSPETLAVLRERQRDLLLASPLMNFRQYAREVEAAYERIWRHWKKNAQRLG